MYTIVCYSMLLKRFWTCCFTNFIDCRILVTMTIKHQIMLFDLKNKPILGECGRPTKIITNKNRSSGHRKRPSCLKAGQSACFLSQPCPYWSTYLWVLHNKQSCFVWDFSLEFRIWFHALRMLDLKVWASSIPAPPSAQHSFFSAWNKGSYY